MEAVEVVNNPARQRFEIVIGGRLAKLNYRQANGEIDLLHTEVPDEFGGRGLGTKLVEAALQYADQNQVKVIPSCPFVADYIERHPEWQKLL